MSCSIEGCDNKHTARGWCRKHYERWRQHGDPLVVKQIRGNDEARFWSKVEKTDSCWIWRAARTSSGYANWYRAGSWEPVHIYSYRLLVGPIPLDLDLDHLCRNPPCVNPDHLEPVTSGENTRRGVGPSALNAAKVVCLHGHDFTDENTYWWRGARACRTCQRIRNREAYWRRKGAVSGE